MEKIKSASLIIVAFLTVISITVSHALGFQVDVAKSSPGVCDKGVDISSGTYYTNGSCSGATANIICVSPHNAFIATKTIQTELTHACNGGNAFCCAEYLPNSTCPGSNGIEDRLIKIICEP